MILGFHVILTTYGFWLPNDPRGSGSSYVGSQTLFESGGPATKVETRHSVASAPYNVEVHLLAKQFLKYPPVVLNGRQALSVAEDFRRKLNSGKFRIYALAILPDHIHTVIGPTRMDIDDVLIQFKVGATKRLLADDRHPFGHLIPEDGGPPPHAFAENGWKVYIDSEEQLAQAIRYVYDNPVKSGKKRQHWSFATPPKGMAIADFYPGEAGAKFLL